MGTEVVRRATVEDLPWIFDIYHEEVVGEIPDPASRPPVPPLFRHELETGEMYVAERDGQVVGYAALIRRGPVAFLAELFVLKRHQSSNLGKALLRHALPTDGGIVCTLSSDDPRAQALYIRAGMRPLWHYFLLRGDASRLGNLEPRGVEIVEAKATDPTLLRWDLEVGGRERPQDHRYWIDGTDALPIWFRRGERTVGYGYLQRRSHDSLEHPNAITIGPLGALTSMDALDAVVAAVQWSRSRRRVMQIGVPGPHPALSPLLHAGFRIVYVDTFMSTDARPFVDVERYIPSGGALF